MLELVKVNTYYGERKVLSHLGEKGIILRGGNGNLAGDLQAEDIDGVFIFLDEFLNCLELRFLKILLTALQHPIPVSLSEAPINQERGFPFCGRLDRLGHFFGGNALYFFPEGLDEFFYLFLG